MPSRSATAWRAGAMLTIATATRASTTAAAATTHERRRVRRAAQWLDVAGAVEIGADPRPQRMRRQSEVCAEVGEIRTDAHVEGAVSHARPPSPRAPRAIAPSRVTAATSPFPDGRRASSRSPAHSFPRTSGTRERHGPARAVVRARQRARARRSAASTLSMPASVDVPGSLGACGTRAARVAAPRRTRFLATLTTIRSSQGRNGRWSSKRSSDRKARMNPSWAASSAPAEPQRTAADAHGGGLVPPHELLERVEFAAPRWAISSLSAEPPAAGSIHRSYTAARAEVPPTPAFGVNRPPKRWYV